jgi:Ankyrin repeats (many copies)/Ankyrin repeats (3 copies)
MNTIKKLIRACWEGNLKDVKYLCPKYFINFKDKKGNTILSYAVEYWNLDILQYLIEQGADVNCRYHIYGYTPILQVIVEEGDYREFSIIETDKLERIKYLVGHGADVNCKCNTGESILMIACQKNYTRIAEFLLENGADANCKVENLIVGANNNSFIPEAGNPCIMGIHSPLLYACKGEYNEKLISLLLKFGADRKYIKETLQKYYIQNVGEEVKKMFDLVDSVNMQRMGILQEDGSAIPVKEKSDKEREEFRNRLIKKINGELGL